MFDAVSFFLLDDRMFLIAVVPLVKMSLSVSPVHSKQAYHFIVVARFRYAIQR